MSRPRYSKQLREARSVAEELGLEDVVFEPRSRHFLLRATYQGRVITTIVSASSKNWRIHDFFRTNLKRSIREASL